MLNCWGLGEETLAEAKGDEGGENAKKNEEKKNISLSQKAMNEHD